MWTTPHDWADGEKVTASLLNLIRDNLRVLYEPPHCRVGGLGSSSKMTADANGNPTWTMLDFPNTIADNDQMRTLTGVGQNEPATGLIETQTAGHYLASAVVAFRTGGNQTLAAAIRASYTSGYAYVGYASGGPATGAITEAIPVLGSYPCSAGYQWFIDFYAQESLSEMVLIRNGKIPYFYLTWIGGP